MTTSPIARYGMLDGNLQEKVVNAFYEGCPEYFEFAHRLNGFGQRLLATMPPVNYDGRRLLTRNVMAVTLFIRAITGYQGMILMSELGMLVEARTLGRNTTDASICLVALVADADFIEHLKTDHFQSRGASIDILLNNDDLGITEEEKEGLREFRMQIDKMKAEQTAKGSSETQNKKERQGLLNVKALAKQAGVDGLYVIYKAFSGESAHASLDALERYLIKTEDGGVGQINAGPILLKTPTVQTLAWSSIALMHATKSLIDQFQLTAFAAEQAMFENEFEIMGAQKQSESPPKSP